MLVGAHRGGRHVGNPDQLVARVGKEQLAVLGQFDGAVDAQEELDGERVFKLANPLGQRLLGEEHRLRGTAEVPVLGGDQGGTDLRR